MKYPETLRSKSKEKYQMNLEEAIRTGHELKEQIRVKSQKLRYSLEVKYHTFLKGPLEKKYQTSLKELLKLKCRASLEEPWKTKYQAKNQEFL